jgi:hypothetical protein
MTEPTPAPDAPSLTIGAAALPGVLLSLADALEACLG